MSRHFMPMILLLWPLFLGGLFRVLLIGSVEAHPSVVLTVNSTSDTGGPVDCGDGNCELREALAMAAMSAGPDSIVFDLPDSSMITLQLGSLPAITETLTIDGSDVVSLTISANNASGIFEIGANAPVTMTNLILRDGQASYGSAINVEDGSLTLLDSRLISNTADYGAIRLGDQSIGVLDWVTIEGNIANYDGGGIHNIAGDLRVNNSVFVGNDAFEGAGIYNSSGTTTVANSTFLSNNAGSGGGLKNWNAGIMTVTNSIFTSNNATGGGGIHNSGVLTIRGSTFLSNSASYAGGSIDNWAGPLTISESTISSNVAGSVGGGIYSDNATVRLTNTQIYSNNAGSGGGIRSHFGILSIIDSTLSANHAGADGGAIHASGTFTATGSTITNNSAGAYGGAIYHNGSGWIRASSLLGNSAILNGGGVYNFSGSSLTITTSTFANNGALDDGGGIYNNHNLSEVTVTDSTFVGNRASSGGGIANNANLTVSNSTFSDNSSNGGSIVNGSALTLTNSTISGNRIGEFAGALYSYGGMTILANSILANSITGSDCLVSGGTLVDEGGNLVEDGSCSFPVGGDPLLGSLQDNGGPAWTHALLPGSPAIDAGNDAICPATDQRGFTRPEDGDGDGEAQCDIGAYELNEPYEGPLLDSLNIVSPVDEGNSTTLSGMVSSTDAGDTLTITIDWDDGTEPDTWMTSPTTFEREHVYDDDGTYTVQVSVTDSHGVDDSDILTVFANNVAPTVDAGPDQSAGVGEMVTVAASFSDPGADSHTATINWGDGTTAPAVVSGNGVSASHIYAAEGSFAVTVTVTDDELGAGSDSFMVVVMAEPNYSLYLPIIMHN